jgi:hypothetical protein
VPKQESKHEDAPLPLAEPNPHDMLRLGLQLLLMGALGLLFLRSASETAPEKTQVTLH